MYCIKQEHEKEKSLMKNTKEIKILKKDFYASFLYKKGKKFKKVLQPRQQRQMEAFYQTKYNQRNIDQEIKINIFEESTLKNN